MTDLQQRKLIEVVLNIPLKHWEGTLSFTDSYVSCRYKDNDITLIKKADPRTPVLKIGPLTIDCYNLDLINLANKIQQYQEDEYKKGTIKNEQRILKQFGIE